MNYVFEAVDRSHFTITAFVGAANDGDFVIFADRDGTDLAERSVVSENRKVQRESWGSLLRARAV